MKDNIIETTRRYKFTQGEIKKKLGLKGSLHQGGLWEGRSPNGIERGEKEDDEIFFIETVERIEQ